MIQLVQVDTVTQMLSAEIQGLANGSGVLQVVGTNPQYDNSASGKGAAWASLFFSGTFVGTPTADSSLEVCFLFNYGNGFGTTVNGASPSVDNNSLKAVLDTKGLSGFQLLPFGGVPLEPYPIILYATNKVGLSLPADSKIYIVTWTEK